MLVILQKKRTLHVDNKKDRCFTGVLLQVGTGSKVAERKVTVCRKWGPFGYNEIWSYGGRTIEVVPKYQYLGILFTHTLSWGKDY